MPMKINQSKLDAAKIILREVYSNKIPVQEIREKKKSNKQPNLKPKATRKQNKENLKSVEGNKS